MSEGPNPGENRSFPPNPATSSSSQSNVTESCPSETSSGSRQETDDQRIMQERPFISSRLSVPNDPVQPRGVSTFSHFVKGYSRNRPRTAFGSGLGMDDELNSSSENPESGPKSSSEVPSQGETKGEAKHLVDCGFGNYHRGPRMNGRPLSGYGKRGNYGNNENSQVLNGYEGFSPRPRKPNAGGNENVNRPNFGYDGNGREYRANFGRGFSGNRPNRHKTEGYSQYNPAFPEQNQSRSHKEPLCLAEELAEEMSRGRKPEDDKSPEMNLQDATIGMLQQLSLKELIAEARRFEIGVSSEADAKKQDVIFSIIKEKIKLNGLLYGEGTLEILPDGFGFLRSTESNYLSCPDDIYVSPSQIRRFGLRNGACVSGQIRPPKESERYFALLRVEAINYHDPNEYMHRTRFEEMIPIHPTRQMKLENSAEEIETRVLDLISPLAFGQCGLLISPKGAGKTTLLTKIALAALKNHPDLYVFLVMIDEPNVDVDGLRKQVKGLNCEVVSSTLNDPVSRHIQFADMILEKARRMVEFGQNVLILVDSLTRLAYAWYSESQMNRSMDGVFTKSRSPKAFLASACAVEDGGSLTILSVLQSEADDALESRIYEEFKGYGNMEIVLDKRLAEQKLWPAIDVNQSHTHCEEMLRTPDEFQSISRLRTFLADLNPVTAMEMLLKRLGKTQSNEEFLESLS